VVGCRAGFVGCGFDVRLRLVAVPVLSVVLLMCGYGWLPCRLIIIKRRFNKQKTD
jgi:hypothetical protein